VSRKRQDKSGSRKKRRRFVVHYPDGSRVLPMAPEMMEALDEQRALFIERFGRPPRPGEPLLFDPDASTPQPLSDEAQAEAFEEMVATLEAIGAAPATIHAVRRTGRIVTEENAALLTGPDLDEWNSAIDEYYAWQTLAEQAAAAGEHPAVVYALGRTGIRLPDPSEYELVRNEEGPHVSASGLVAEWFEAVTKYVAEHPDDGWPSMHG
jgi:hypothetical protein